MASARDRPVPPGEDRVHTLVVVSGNEVGRRIELSGRPLTIGRAADSDIRIRDPELSSHHCTAGLALDQVLIADLKSTNGTFIEGRRIEGSVVLPAESLLQIGRHALKHEYRSRGEVKRIHEQKEDLDAAAGYVRALLPKPLTQGPVRTDWIYRPCTQLGGDAFGYQSVDEDGFAIYLLDVSGHGTGSALHAVSVLNVLGLQSLPNTDFRSPQHVLARLNSMFRMDRHADKYLTMWYGVYDAETRELVYASAGHPPASLVSANRDRMLSLQTHNPGIGLFPDAHFDAQSVAVPPDSSLYLFSDGAYEIPLPSQEEWTLEALQELIQSPTQSAANESERVYRSILDACALEALPDDCSIVVARFS